MGIWEHDFSIYCLALTICTNSGFKEAPPTKKPSMSGLAANSLQLAAVTDPPYWIRMAAATSAETLSLNHFLNAKCTS